MSTTSQATPPAGVDATYPFIGHHRGHRTAVILAAVVPFALTILAIALLWGRHVTWLDLGLLVGLQALATLGITLGYHRMTAHGAFKAPAPVRAVLLAMAAMSIEGGPASWAATHRRHHALSDKPGDPHSPLDGLWHSHFGWLAKGNLVHSGPGHERLMRDPVVRFFEKTQLAWVVASIVLPGLVGLAVVGTWGAFWQALLWGGVVRVFLVHHITWSINSICHTVGTRPYESPDTARNNALFGVLAFGEGWHNNHHAFPDSAYLGHRWYQVDLGKYVLLMLRPLRLVHDLRIPTKQQQAARLRKKPTKAPRGRRGIAA